MTSAVQLLQSNTLLSYKHRYQMFMHTDCCLHFLYTLAAFEDCAFLEEIFSFE